MVRRRKGDLFQPEDTCWRVETADRVALLLDSGAYFTAAMAAMRRARRSIVLLGWGFDPRTRLKPDPSGEEHGPDEIGNLLIKLSRQKPDLDIHILIWKSAFPSAPRSTSSRTGPEAGSPARASISSWTPRCPSGPATTRRC